NRLRRGRRSTAAAAMGTSGSLGLGAGGIVRVEAAEALEARECGVVGAVGRTAIDGDGELAGTHVEGSAPRLEAPAGWCALFTDWQQRRRRGTGGLSHRIRHDAIGLQPRCRRIDVAYPPEA